MAWLPAPSVARAPLVAAPLTRATAAPKLAPSTTNWTLPVGVGPPATPATDAVKLTDWPYVEVGRVEPAVTVATAAPAVTVSTVLPLTPPRVADIEDVPAFTAVARPAALIVATVVVAEAQVTWPVRFCVVLSLNVPV